MIIHIAKGPLYSRWTTDTLVSPQVLCDTFDYMSTNHMITQRVDWEDRTWYPWDEPTCNECILLYFAMMSNDDNTRV